MTGGQYGWMIRVLEEGYRLSKMDELNGKVFILRSTVDEVLRDSRIEIQHTEYRGGCRFSPV